jgi:hypothetical protein
MVAQGCADVHPRRPQSRSPVWSDRFGLLIRHRKQGQSVNQWRRICFKEVAGKLIDVAAQLGERFNGIEVIVGPKLPYRN